MISQNRSNLYVSCMGSFHCNRAKACWQKNDCWYFTSFEVLHWIGSLWIFFPNFFVQIKIFYKWHLRNCYLCIFLGTHPHTHSRAWTHAQTRSLSFSSAKFSLDGVLSDLLSIFFSPSQPFVCLQVDATNFHGAFHLLKWSKQALRHFRWFEQLKTKYL